MVLPARRDTAPTERAVTRAVVVIPCFNEAERLDRPAVLALAERPGLGVVLVDDGSTDATGALLEELATRSPSIDVVRLATNEGKGEAVRAGLLRALQPGVGGPGPDVVAYFDADFATPADELLRLIDVAVADASLAVVAGSRYGHAAAVRRRPDRRVLGVVYSRVARRALGIAIHDTQCGAKVLRAGTTLERALREPFGGRWAFDIELLDRLLAGTGGPAVAPAAIVEVPLVGWTDRPGSKLGAGAMAGALVQVVRLGTRRGWRTRPATPRVPASTRRRGSVTVDLVAAEAAGAVTALAD